jgi:hypothetical protein
MIDFYTIKNTRCHSNEDGMVFRICSWDFIISVRNGQSCIAAKLQHCFLPVNTTLLRLSFEIKKGQPERLTHTP